MSDKPAGWLFVVPWDLHHPGGVNQVVINLAKEVNRRGDYRPLLLVTDWNAPVLTADTSQGMDTYRMRLRPPWESSQGAQGSLAFLCALPAQLNALRRFLARHRVAVVNTHIMQPASIVFALLTALGLYRGRIIHSCHGVDLECLGSVSAMKKWLWRWMLRHSDGVVACSAALARRYAEIFGPGVSKVYVVHNGVDGETLLSITSAEDDAARDGIRNYILNIGTFEHKKGQDVLIAAFDEIAVAHPDIDLVMIGRTTPHLAAIREIIARSKFSSRIHVLTDMPHERAMAFVRSARLFVLPSRVEPFGIVLLEAGIYRCPVVATRVGGIPEIIEDGVNGILVPADDPHVLAQGTSELLARTDEAKRMADRLHEDVQQRFTWRAAYDRYLQVLSSGGGSVS